MQLPGAFLLAGGALLALSVLLLGLLWRERRRRRRAERSTAEHQSQLQTVTATMREGVIAYDMEQRLTFVNPAFERLTGYPVEDIRDQEFLQYIHPDDRPALLAEWDRLAQGGCAPRPGVPGRHPRPGRCAGPPAPGSRCATSPGVRSAYLGTEFDITERKLAEEAMRLDTELFQAVIEVQQAVRRRRASTRRRSCASSPSGASGSPAPAAR